MKAIVVIFVQTHDLKLPAGEPLAVLISGNSEAVSILGTDKTNRVDKASINQDESVPPFWTWFIENPRPHSSRSFRSLADLIFAA
jgi:hypothetical protein